MPYNFTAAGALVFRAIVALISRVHYGPSIERVESNIGDISGSTDQNLHLQAKAKRAVK